MNIIAPRTLASESSTGFLKPSGQTMSTTRLFSAFFLARVCLTSSTVYAWIIINMQIPAIQCFDQVVDWLSGETCIRESWDYQSESETRVEIPHVEFYSRWFECFTKRIFLKTYNIDSVHWSDHIAIDNVSHKVPFCVWKTHIKFWRALSLPF